MSAQLQWPFAHGAAFRDASNVDLADVKMLGNRTSCGECRRCLMTIDRSGGEMETLMLTEDERLIVLHLRMLHIERDEAMRRLSTPPSWPVLPCGQELQANLQAVAADPLMERPAPANTDY
jgi:hypothetical protein